MDCFGSMVIDEAYQITRAQAKDSSIMVPKVVIKSKKDVAVVAHQITGWV